MDCPSCAEPMTLGALVLAAPWNPLVQTMVRWQPTLPNRALRAPEGSKVVLRSTAFRRQPRLAHHCPRCATVVVPPDEAYDADQP